MRELLLTSQPHSTAHTLLQAALLDATCAQVQICSKPAGAFMGTRNRYLHRRLPVTIGVAAL